MSKLSWFLMFLTLSIVMTFLVDAYTSSLLGITPPGIANPAQIEINNIGDAFGAIVSFFGTYISIAFFQIKGLPPLFNILFIVSNAAMIYAVIK